MKRLATLIIILVALSGCKYQFLEGTAGPPAIPPTVQRVSDATTIVANKVVADGSGNIGIAGAIAVGTSGVISEDGTDMTFTDGSNLAGVTLSTLAAGAGTDDQTAAEVANTPAGNIEAITVQAAIDELDGEKLALAGGTLTGNVILDDGTGDSPSVTLTDATDETTVITKLDGAYTTITTAAADGVNILVGNLKVGNGVPGQTINGEDAYVEGLLEVDSMIHADGGVTGALTGSATQWGGYGLPADPGADRYLMWDDSETGSEVVWGIPGGAGDVTGVGDCTGGDCFDGSDDGGTQILFYDAQGATTLAGGDTSGAVALTLPTTTGTLALTTIAPTNVTPVDTADENATFYPILVDGATGSQATETDAGISYNPSTNILTLTGIPVGPASDPTTDNQFARKAYVDSVAAGGGLPTTGGTMTGNITLDDGTTDSPSIIFTDETDETATLTKTDSGFLGITTAAADGVSILVGNLKVGDGSPTTAQDGEDFYVNGAAEIDGNAVVDGTFSAGAAGFTVDADGDTTVKSLATTKASGVAGDIGLYEANSTDTHDAGFRGPLSITGDGAYRGQFPNARATSANMVMAWTNGSESGSGTALDPYIQAISWIDLDTYALIESINTPAELESVASLGAYASDILAATNEANFKSTVNLEPNTDFVAPTGTADIATTGIITGLTKAVSIGNCEGAHDGDGNAATLSDSGESLTVDAYIGMTVYNITDGSSCTVTDNDATTITCTLAGGTENDWDASDVWQVGPGPYQSGSVFYISSATTIAHPATAGYVAGYFAAGAVIVKVDPYSASMTINFSDDGTYTDPGAGDEIDGDGTQGDFIWIHNASATEAYSHGVNGSWADGGAS